MIRLCGGIIGLVRYPDFKHKKTQEALWIDGKSVPPWVKSHLASMEPGIVQPCLFSWTMKIARSVKDGEDLKALQIFKEMQAQAIIIDRFTYVEVLKSCANIHALEECRCTHTCLIQDKCNTDPFVGSSLVDTYSKCGSIEDAFRVFNGVSTQDVVSWNAMLNAYLETKQGAKGLDLFKQMQRERVQPDKTTFVSAINLCTCAFALDEGRRVHAEVIQRGWEHEVAIRNSLVDLYSTCGSIEDACSVFNCMHSKDCISWNVMSKGYINCDHAHKALRFFEQMQREKAEPDRVTFVSVIQACAARRSLDDGRQIHAEVIRRGYEGDIIVGNSLIGMYDHCGSIVDACRNFNNMPTRDVISWSAMMLGLVKYSQGRKALDLFRLMQMERIQLDKITYMSLLVACSSIAALEEGRLVHAEIIQSGCESDLTLQNCLVSMYAKCGSIEDAQRVFYCMPKHNVISSSAMLGGYARYGLGKEALRLFEQMLSEGMHTDKASFICLLSACNHTGLLDEGQYYLESMCALSGVPATIEHYSCMVDLLGRIGCLKEAEDLIQTMPCIPDVTVWTSLLGACRNHGDVKRGERCAMRVLDLEPELASGYVLLSDIYAAAGKWDSKANIRHITKGKTSTEKAWDYLAWININCCLDK
ncbi:hypothetical protein O6H91_18G084900 [Diphasiastrum complanatum]|uniref:Uncharacterized protein n=1 Tax=Diphasiastrum complanatum TaxID=34168 RepID=A0ACC2B3H3_DIPCM|nr:hypothetical protein O6H91_18G084900 [Diphasiastrum complanatum]